MERKRTAAGAIRRCLILVQAALSSTDTPNIAIDMAKKNEASLAHVLGAFPRGRHLSTGGDLYRLRRHIFHHHLSQSLGVNWLYHKFRNLQAHGHAIDPGELARVSPLAHRHINFLGRYAFTLPEPVARGELRPLRDPNSNRTFAKAYVSRPFLSHARSYTD